MSQGCWSLLSWRHTSSAWRRPWSRHLVITAALVSSTTTWLTSAAAVELSVIRSTKPHNSVPTSARQVITENCIRLLDTADKTRSSAIAVIADRTAYDIRYNGKLLNRFRLVVTILRTAGMHDPIQGVEFMNAPKLCLLKRDDWASQPKVQ